MKKILIGLLLAISLNSFAQNLECGKYKNGKFKIIDSVRSSSSIITRKGSTQIEYDENLKLRLEFKVKWIDDCTYTLELRKILENPQKIPIPKDMILTIEIIETKENSYIQKTSSNLYDMILKSEVLKIE